MPHKLRRISGSELISAFQKLGFEIKSQKGSHIKMKNINNRIISIVNHKEIDKGTLNAIYKQALVLIPESDLQKIFYTDEK